ECPAQSGPQYSPRHDECNRDVSPNDAARGLCDWASVQFCLPAERRLLLLQEQLLPSPSIRTEIAKRKGRETGICTQERRTDKSGFFPSWASIPEPMLGR